MKGFIIIIQDREKIALCNGPVKSQRERNLDVFVC